MTELVQNAFHINPKEDHIYVKSRAAHLSQE